MRWQRFLIIMILAALLNTGNLLNGVSVGSLNIRPDLPVILLVFFAINCPMPQALVVSFVIGFVADIPQPVVGPYIISLTLLGAIISHMSKVVITKKMLHQGLIILVTGLVAGALAEGLTFLKIRETTSNLYLVLLGTAVYSAIIGPFVWLGLSAISDWLGIRKNRYRRSANR